MSTVTVVSIFSLIGNRPRLIPGLLPRAQGVPISARPSRQHGSRRLMPVPMFAPRAGGRGIIRLINPHAVARPIAPVEVLNEQNGTENSQ